MFFYIVLTPMSTTSGLWSIGNTRKYQQIDVYIYQCVNRLLATRKIITKYINQFRWHNYTTSPLKIDETSTSTFQLSHTALVTFGNWYECLTISSLSMHFQWCSARRRATKALQGGKKTYFNAIKSTEYLAWCTLILLWKKTQTLKTHYHNSAIFSQTLNAIEKLYEALNVQLKIGINQSLIWLYHNVTLLEMSNGSIRHPVLFCKVSWCLLVIFFCLHCSWYDTNLLTFSNQQ